MNGRNSAEGRIEVFVHGRWGTVCDDSFDIKLKEAHVICRILGLSPAQRVTKFGSRTGLNWLDELNCRGNETSINECAHRSIGRHDCGHHEDIGVVCTRSKLLQHSIVIILSSDFSTQERDIHISRFNI